MTSIVRDMETLLVGYEGLGAGERTERLRQLQYNAEALSARIGDSFEGENREIAYRVATSCAKSRSLVSILQEVTTNGAALRERLTAERVRCVGVAVKTAERCAAQAGGKGCEGNAAELSRELGGSPSEESLERIAVAQDYGNFVCNGPDCSALQACMGTVHVVSKSVSGAPKTQRETPAQLRLVLSELRGELEGITRECR